MVQAADGAQGWSTRDTAHVGALPGRGQARRVVALRSNAAVQRRFCIYENYHGASLIAACVLRLRLSSCFNMLDA